MSTDGVAPAVGASDASPAQPVQNANSNSSQNGTPVNSVAQANVGGDSLTCQWQSCGERCATAEALYDHVCERHVGRKSTNNLNLTCQWGNCRTTTVKRDHITSHIRVHVPLKPHKCDFCGKAFKRPQDLKKHVKTHADDSVLLRSPEPNRANQNGPGGGYQPANSNKLVADLQTLAATASGYYPDHGLSGAGSYYQNGNAQGPYHSAAAAAPSGSAYGPVYYAVNQAASLGNDYEVRKRAAFDALNEFFGDAKRRIIDPATYYDVGHRLMSLQGVQLPMLGTVGGGYSSSDSYGGGMAAPAAHLPQQHYTLPLPNLRTKNDLLNIDQFLEQLQSTVYENSNHAAAAGVAQAGAHYTPTGYGYGRSSHSPPSAAHGTSHAGGLGASHPTSVAPLTTPQTETPALTPASSVMSYNSNAGQSPNSVHSTHNISPSRVSNAMSGSMYPTLPSVSAMGDMSASGYSTSGAPASSLATAFDSDHRRRYSGGLLQKEAPARRSSYDSRMDEDTPTQSPKAAHSQDGSRSPSSVGDEERGRQLGRDVRKLNIMSPSMIDPAMRSPGDSKSSGSPAEDAGTPGRDDADSKQEAWVENIRMIEMLKDFVKGRLERGEYETEGSSEEAESSSAAKGEPMEEDEKTEDQKDAENLYPVLRAVQGEA